MLLISPASLFISTFFLSTASIAAPTRAHCRCTIVSDTAPLSQHTPSSAHWTPSEPLPSPSVPDVCGNLGLELESFRHSQPSLFDSYIYPNGHSKPSPASDAQQPISTTVLLDLAARYGFQNTHLEDEQEPRPTSRPHERIVCHSEPEPFSAYQDSFVTLWALHVIVALAIFACAAEGVHLGMRWMNRRNDANHNHISEKPKSRLRLTGAEKLLCAFPPSVYPNSMFSPGVEKKTQAYLDFVVKAPCEKREFIAYDDEEDDEANWPVM
ncbi:hypothetical protein P153DRAFT_185068 [Dothidotthia symphoricarpi CBS 119687]|uniref:Uncharacterized protein n=1 Tax=Dothidotthia symphoricarpi CBS 119687 TaxID=1392245 RepID=A0A6A6ALU6_9PLEO|nr:uncharacterized protein P153DRAFT_185068 [Dothidotthia symphoricarpi CBS 119687]KAF2132143.1 hypothetical protein P153DRAFT_185068 [Dothidotthia symphoricarpi CBS 119687]